MQPNLIKYYRFERADTLCEHFNKFISILKREREQKEWVESYLWLDPSDDKKIHDRPRSIRQIYRLRKVMFDRERKERSNGNVV